jgi:hypothetical protein
MPTLDDAFTIAFALPEVWEKTTFGNRGCYVGTKLFAWERPLSKADVKRWGDATPPPQGDLFAVRTDGLHEKEALLAAGIKGVFTIEHFDNYPSVLLQLQVITKTKLKNLIVDAWLATAPDQLAEAYLAAKRKR